MISNSWRNLGGALAASTFLLAGCVTTTSPVKFPTQANAYQGYVSKETALFRPAEGAGPFPAVVVIHACGGIAPHIGEAASHLTKEGYVVLVIDSLGSRKLHTCWSGPNSPKLTIDQAVADAAAGIAHLRALPFVKPDAIGFVGFSLGGGVGLRLASRSYQGRLGEHAGALRAIAAFYPTCARSNVPVERQVEQIENLFDPVVTPTKLHLGGQDTEADPAFCTRKIDGMKAEGQPIDYKLYPQAAHAFDQAVFRGEGRLVGGHPYRYDADATNDAWRDVKVFFERHLKGMKAVSL